MGLTAGRAKLEIVFPTLPIDRVGCAADSGRRLYYWIASANYAGAGYPSNHFQQVRAWFYLPQSIAVGTAQFDSAIARQQIIVDEAGGEPPMRIGVVSIDGGLLTTQIVNGGRDLRARIIVAGRKAAQSMVATRDSVVSLAWCDSAKPYQFMIAPFQR